MFLNQRKFNILTISLLKKDLKKYINEEKKEFLPKFFKTGKGEYGEGDKFLGIVVPDIAKVAKKYSDLTKEDIRKLLNSPWHEERFCGWLVVLNNFNKSDKKDEWYKFQLQNCQGWPLSSLLHIETHSFRSLIFKISKVRH